MLERAAKSARPRLSDMSRLRAVMPGIATRRASSITLQISWLSMPATGRSAALREAALGFFGFTITMVAQTQEPSGLKPVPRLLPGVLVDVGAHAGAKRVGGALFDLGALAM